MGVANLRARHPVEMIRIMYWAVAATFAYSAVIILFVAVVGGLMLYVQDRTIWWMTRQSGNELKLVKPADVPRSWLSRGAPLPVVYFWYGFPFLIPVLLVAAILTPSVAFFLFGPVASSGWGSRIVFTVLVVIVFTFFYGGLFYATCNLLGHCDAPRAHSLLPARSMASMRARLRMFWRAVFAVPPQLPVFAGVAIAMARNVNYGSAPEIVTGQINLIAIGGLVSAIVLPRVVRLVRFMHFLDAHILWRIQNVLGSSWSQFEGYRKLDDPLGFARAELYDIQLSLIGRSRQYERSARGAPHPLATVYSIIAHELYDFVASERSLVRELPEDVKVRLEEIAVSVAGGPVIRLLEKQEFTSSYEVLSLWARIRRAVGTGIESADPLEKTATALVKIAVLVILIYLVSRGHADLPALIRSLLK
ncbi:MAG: hypothetical protein ACRDQJ_05650 [Pseudonocardiaceae bacterium]